MYLANVVKAWSGANTSVNEFQTVCMSGMSDSCAHRNKRNIDGTSTVEGRQKVFYHAGDQQNFENANAEMRGTKLKEKPTSIYTGGGGLRIQIGNPMYVQRYQNYKGCVNPGAYPKPPQSYKIQSPRRP